MDLPHPAGSAAFRGIHSKSGLILAVIAVLVPFSALLTHQLDGLALISLPLAIIATRMERDAKRRANR